jgi:hypothetical protein
VSGSCRCLNMPKRRSEDSDDDDDMPLFGLNGLAENILLLRQQGRRRRPARPGRPGPAGSRAAPDALRRRRRPRQAGPSGCRAAPDASSLQAPRVACPRSAWPGRAAQSQAPRKHYKYE